MQILKIAILALSLSLTACGFQLGSARSLPTELKTVYLEGGSRQFRDQFSNVLELSSGRLVKTPEQAGIVVRILDEKARNRTLSLSVRGRANDYEIGYVMDYELTDAKNNVLLVRQPIEILREYYNDQQFILAKANEELVIRDEIYEQAARTIIDRARIVIAAKH